MNGTSRAVLKIDSIGSVTMAGKQIFGGSTAELLDAFRAVRRGGGRHLVLTLNVDQLLRWEKDSRFRAAYEESSIRTIDGMPVLGLSRLLGSRHARRITGADLLPAVVQAAARDKTLVAITGGSQEDLESAGTNLRHRYPGANVEVIPFPKWSVQGGPNQSTSAVIECLNELRPDVTFICLGSPKQELWYMQVKEYLPDGVYVGAGAAVDFAAGRIPRAPQIVQAAGAEWLWRLSLQPRRLWRRYLVRGPLFIAIAFRSIRVGIMQ
jgi:N-acetylglucosaminyldiphosphoundecaprenol N-acetyl-beta-D-mannosaminyltransferase